MSARVRTHIHTRAHINKSFLLKFEPVLPFDSVSCNVKEQSIRNMERKSNGDVVSKTNQVNTLDSQSLTTFAWEGKVAVGKEK